MIADILDAGQLGGEVLERAGNHRKVAQRREHDRFVGFSPYGRHLGAWPNVHGCGLGPGEPERDRGVCGGGRKEPHADQFEELDVVALGHAVEPVEHLVGHPGEGFDQGHARIGDIVIRPFGATLLDESLGVVNEVLEATVVQVGYR